MHATCMHFRTKEANRTRETRVSVCDTAPLRAESTTVSVRNTAGTDRVLVLLGCPVGPSGLPPTAARRAKAAADAFHAGLADVVVASGGRTWSGRVEADVLADALARHGVPKEAIVRERCSFSTRENASFTAKIMERRGITRALVVTCTWHLPRAERAFRESGLVVEGIPVPIPRSTSRARRGYFKLREAIATWLGH